MTGPAFGVTRSLVLQATFGLLERVAASGSPLLLQGEAGTGKEWLARRIHALFPLRRGGAFVRLDLALGSPAGLELRLTSALEDARGGTLLVRGLERLDPGALEHALELLTGLTEWGVEPGGSRLILATRRGAIAGRLSEGEVAAELLRARLKLVRVALPPLRERRVDLEALIAALSPAPPLLFEPAALEALRAYDWPGNVRELAQELTRLRETCRRWRVRREDLAPAIRGPAQDLQSVEDGEEPSQAAIERAERPLGGSLLVMAARDGELPPAEAAALEDRFQALDPLLQAEWEWLERTRAAVGALRPAAAGPEELARLCQEIQAELREEAETAGEDPVREVREAFQGQAGKLSLRDLERRGFRQVKVLRAGDVNQLIARAVERALAGEASPPLEGDPDGAQELPPALRGELHGRVAMLLHPGSAHPGSARPGSARPGSELGGGGHAAVSEDKARRAIERLRALRSGKAPAREEAARRAPSLEDEAAWRVRLEADVGRWLQHLPLPERQVLTAQVELCGQLESAPEVGGDAWGWLDLPGGELFAWVLDGSGRGVEVASLLLEAGAALRAAVEPGGSPAAALVRVNRALRARGREGSFASALLVRWDPGARRLTVANAGHEPPAVRRAATGRVELLRCAGAVLGPLSDAAFATALQERTLELAPGDALLLHTDGATEVPGQDFHALHAALLEGFARHGQERAPEALEQLRRELTQRVGPAQHDDRTLVVLRRL